MYRNSQADFTNWQVLLLTKSHPGERIINLVPIAKQEMPATDWNYDEVRNAANRLAQKGRIEIDGARVWPKL